MPHIHTGPGQHDLTVSAYVVRLDTPQPSIMLHKHKKLGTFMQFGGHVELHEDPWQAVIHELSEESGYEIGQLRLLQPDTRLPSLSDATLHPVPLSLQTHKFGDIDHFHTDVSFAFVTHESPKHKIADGESADVRNFTLDQLRALTPDAIRKNVKETCIFVLKDCLHKWQQVRTGTK